MFSKLISFKHSGNCGDVVYALPSIKAYCEKHNAEAVIYLKLNVPSNFTIATHPVGNVQINQAMADMVKPLLMAQSYIQNVIIYEHESIPDIDFDLDRFRKDYLNLSAGNIAQWIGNSYPELRPNLFEPSINIAASQTKENYIIVNRSQRYQNLYFDYSILANYDNVYFVGVEKEFRALHIHNPKIEHLIVDDFYQMAQWIAGCRLFIGNQSMAFAIAEQLKVKRILEQYAIAPNVIPQGGEYFVCHTEQQFRDSITFALSGESTNKDKTQTRQTPALNGC